jgi:hypothetical protein
LCRAEKRASVNAAVGICSFASEERRSRRRQMMRVEGVGMVVGIIFYEALGDVVGVLLFVVFLGVADILQSLVG